MRDAGHVEVRSGGGAVALFGLPFLLLGLAAVTSPMWAGDGPIVGSSLFGLVFAGVGAVLVFGRAGVRIDRRADRVERWWGLLVPVIRKPYALGMFDRVTIKREVRRSKNSSRTVYPVRLEGADVVDCHTSSSFDEARAKAEDVAKGCGLDLHDLVNGSVRAAADLDKSIRQRAREARTEVRSPGAPPPGTKIDVTHGAEGVEYRLPPPGLRAPLLVALGGVIVFDLVALFVFVLPMMDDLELDLSTPLTYAIVVFTVFFFGAPLVTVGRPVIAAVIGKERLVASRTQLAFERAGLFVTRTETIPAGQLEELDVSNGAIRARSDETSIAFGAGLDSDDLRWLHASLYYHLAG